MMDLDTEAREIAEEALRGYDGDVDDARERVHELCDEHRVAVHYEHALELCEEQDTSGGEEWLEFNGGIAQPGDSFSMIACRVAFATLLVAASDALHDILSEEQAESDAETEMF